MMNAAVYDRFGGPITVRSMPIPACPPDGILVQVKATGVCRSDWHGWAGHDDDIRDHGLPFIPGHEFSGVVVQSNVSNLMTGDRVAVPFILSCGSCHFCQEAHRPTVCQNQQQPGFTYMGSFAEYVAVPWAQRNVHKLPPQVSFLQAAALGCRFTTAYRGVIQQGRLARDECVAIFGCGGVGLSCIMIAAATGLPKVIVAVDVSEAALQKARSLGATHCVLVTPNSRAEETQRQVVEYCYRQGAHVSIDAAGFTATCENAIHSTRRAGRMVQVGLPIDNSKRLPVVPMGRVAGWELELIGSHGFAAHDMPQLLELVASGRLDPSRLVQRQVNLAEGARELQDMDKGSPLGITMITSFAPGSRL